MEFENGMDMLWQTIGRIDTIIEYAKNKETKEEMEKIQKLIIEAAQKIRKGKES